MGATKNQRDSNLEVLRIISMIFIIIYHFATDGCDSVNFVASNFNNYFLYFLSLLGELGVDIFILISAYFMINSKFKFRKLFILGGEVYFYSLIFLILFCTVLNPIKPISYFDIFRSILPISHSLYWFITDYIVLMLLSPFLNKFIKKISKEDLLKLIVITLIIWSIFPTFTSNSFHFNSVCWFIVLYLIGSFIRLYLDISKINSKYFVLIFITSLIIGWLFISGSLSISFLNQFYCFKYKTSMFRDMNSIFIVSASLSLFLIFLKREKFSNKYLNYISGSVLGVYLIHGNSIATPYIWKSILQVISHYFSQNLILLAILSTSLIYLICTGIDIIRRLTLEKIWIWVVDNKLNFIRKLIDNTFKFFEVKLNNYLI